MVSPEIKPLPIRIFNRINKVIDFQGSLSFDGLIRKASKNTGLNDLGSDFNDLALKTLIRSINEEAGLNPFGQLMIREKLISQLENRLWAEHWFNNHPEILEQELLPIIMITGLQRTGTTKMQRLLSTLSGARGLYSWEALYPSPIGHKDEIEQRIKRTRRNEKAVRYISPVFQSIHPIHTDQPEEDVVLLDLHFMSTTSEAILHVPAYAEWLENQDQQEAYRYEEKLLKLLQWQRGGDFWVLKSPHHLQYLADFSKVFKNSSIVWMHRDPVHCVPSFLSMLFYSRSMFCDKVDVNELKRHWLQKLQEMIEAGLKFKDKSPDLILDLNFQDLVNSERDTINRILRFVNISIPEADLDIVNDRGDGYVSKHKYSLDDWELTENQIATMFKNYSQMTQAN